MYRCISSAYLALLQFLYFFFNDPATTEIYTLSLHDALPICSERSCGHDATDRASASGSGRSGVADPRSEEHTSELQSHHDLVCRLLLEKKKKKHNKYLPKAQ